MRACRSRSRLSCRGRPSRFASVSSLRARRARVCTRCMLHTARCRLPLGGTSIKRATAGKRRTKACQRCSVWQWRRKDCGVLHETLEARLCGRGSWRSSSKSMCYESLPTSTWWVSYTAGTLSTRACGHHSPMAPTLQSCLHQRDRE